MIISLYHDCYNRKYYLLIMVSGITSIVHYYFPIFQLTDYTFINSLFKSTTKELINSNTLLFKSNKITLVLLFLAKSILYMFSVTLPIPCGLLVPLFSLGALIGRFVGEFQDIIPANILALLCSAAIASGTTQVKNINKNRQFLQ